MLPQNLSVITAQHCRGVVLIMMAIIGLSFTIVEFRVFMGCKLQLFGKLRCILKLED